MIGLTGFGLASALSGLAWTPGVLVASRVLQGGFAAIVMPQSLAAIRALFPPQERARALGFYGATFGAGSVLGQLLGGVLIAADPLGLGWRSVFLVNLPVVIAVVPLAMALLPGNRGPRMSTVDAGGVVLLAVALSALVVPLTEGPEHGWPWWAVLLLVCCVPLVILFWRHEGRVVARGADPLLAPALLRIPGLARGLLAALFFNAFASLFLVFSLYQQAGRQQTPLGASLAVLPLGVGFVLSPLTTAALTRRLGHRANPLGMSLVTIGMVVTAIAAQLSSSYLAVPALFVIGLGQGLTLPTLVRSIVDRVHGRWAGLSAGLVNSVLQISGSLAVALVGALFYAVEGPQPSPATVADAFTVATLAIALSTATGAWLINGVHPADRDSS